MDKEDLKIILIIGIVSCYLVSLMLLLFVEPLVLFIVNIAIWLMIIIWFLGLKFIDWLNDY